MRKQKAIEIAEHYRSLDGVRVEFIAPPKTKEPYIVRIYVIGTDNIKDFEIPRGEFRKLKEQEFYVVIQKYLDEFRAS